MLQKINLSSMITTILIAAVSTLISTNALCEKSLPFLNHVSVLQELKQRFAPKNTSVVSKKPSNNLSQTEAYMSVYEKDIKRKWSTELKEHAKLIKTLVQREKEFADTHYVFYHAHTKELKIFQDFVKKLRSYIELEPLPAHFTFMRFKRQNATNHLNAQDFLDNNTIDPVFDHNEHIAAHLISANLSLFGNNENWGECSFYYFLHNKSQLAHTEQYLKSVFNFYRFDTTFMKELLCLYQYLTSETGVLQQIFIPKNLVDALTYLSKPLGVPYNVPIVSNCFDSTKERHLLISPILDRYRTTPSSISKLDDLQARVLFFDPMFDPESGIKIFSYDTISPENKQQYEEKLSGIVKRIVQSYLNKANDTQQQVPLIKLYGYIRQNIQSIQMKTGSNHGK